MLVYPLNLRFFFQILILVFRDYYYPHLDYTGKLNVEMSLYFVLNVHTLRK